MKASLPDLPSELLELALRDLEACEVDSATYRIRMDCWHGPHRWLEQTGPNSEVEHTSCVVCLAGAVMAQTLDVPANETCGYSKFMDLAVHTDTSRRLLAIDSFRRGHISEGLCYMKIAPALGNVPVRQYSSDPEGFKLDMKGIITSLKLMEANL